MNCRWIGQALFQFVAGMALVHAGIAADPDVAPQDPAPILVLDHGERFRPKSLGGQDLILLALAFSLDGKVLASSGGGEAAPNGVARGEVNLWEVATGKRLESFVVKDSIVFDVEFSPNGKLLAAASGPGTPKQTTPGEIRLWNAATYRHIRTLQGHDCGAYTVAFSRDSKQLASGGIARLDQANPSGVRGGHARGDLKLWDLQSGQVLWTRGGHSGAVSALVFSADGKRLVSSGGLSDGQVRLWEVPSGLELATLTVEADLVFPAAWRDDAIDLVIQGSDIAGRKRSPFSVQVARWDPSEARPTPIGTVSGGNAYRMALSGDSRLLACACHDGVNVLDLAQQAELCRIPSKHRLRPIAFSPDNKLLAAGSDDGTVKLWNVAELRKQ